jgi:hypothetical protein
MSQRNSGYDRQVRDLYETPPWVTHALKPHLPNLSSVWEPACGGGAITRVFTEWGIQKIYESDINVEQDFLTHARLPVEAIITNPPYDKATEFCEHALRLTRKSNGIVAMLLRTDFDHAKGRVHLFRDCEQFAKKLVLMKRICWFVEDNGRPKASPSFNHAWYIWNWTHNGAPSIVYGP